jgi:Transcriptional regulator DIP2311-like, C-terminal domain
VRQNGSTARNELKRTQELVLDVLRADTATPLTRARYQEIAGVSRSQAAYDLAELVEAGIVERVGAGPATRYRLVDSRPDDRRRWTNERIRSALQEFCAEREAWPSAREFKEGGRHDLYVAASRYGGVAFWAKELGFARPGRPLARTPVPVGPRPRRLRLRWTAEAAAVAVALAVAGVSLLHPWDTTNGLQRSAASPPQARGPVAAVHVTGKRSAAARQAVRKTNPVKQAKRPIRRSPSGTSSTATSQLIAQRTSSVPTHASSTEATTTRSTPQQSASSTPAPLQAPTGPAAPSPLPPPGK